MLTYYGRAGPSLSECRSSCTQANGSSWQAARPFFLCCRKWSLGKSQACWIEWLDSVTSLFPLDRRKTASVPSKSAHQSAWCTGACWCTSPGSSWSPEGRWRWTERSRVWAWYWWSSRLFQRSLATIAYRLHPKLANYRNQDLRHSC